MNKPKEIDLNIPIIALIGRTNVGKSTLFNRLIEKDKAITSRIAGTTRDRNWDICNWGEKQCIVMDTAGIAPQGTEPIEEIEKNVQKQIKIALKNCDLIYFVVDIRTGIMPDDKKIIQKLKKSNKPFIVILNKADNQRVRLQAAEFYALGVKKLFPVSAKSGSGTADLLNHTMEKLFPNQPPIQTEHIQVEPDFSIAIVGKPNVGKSSLLNGILGSPRSIVSSTAHTTREPLDTFIEYQNSKIKIIDTAGIRRKYKSAQEIEAKSVKKGILDIHAAEICLFVIDANSPIDFQDKKIAGQLINNWSSVIIIANKIDLVKSNQIKTETLRKKIYGYFPRLRWAPIIFTCALTGSKVDKVMNKVMEVSQERKNEIQGKTLEKLVKYIIKKYKIQPKKKYQSPTKTAITYIYGITQKQSNPPIFELVVNKKENMPTAVIQLIKNKLIEIGNFSATPISLRVRSIKKK